MFDETLVEWDSLCSGTAADAFPFLIEGRCANGKRLLYYGSGFSIERRYFDASGKFLGLETAGDGGQGPACDASAYWPVRVTCERAEVTRVVCGTDFAVGDSIPL